MTTHSRRKSRTRSTARMRWLADTRAWSSAATRAFGSAAPSASMGASSPARSTQTGCACLSRLYRPVPTELRSLSARAGATFEVHQHGTQQPGQSVPLRLRQPAEQPAFPVEQVGEGSIDTVPTAVGEADPTHPAVLRIGSAVDQPAGLQPVEPVGRGTRTDQGLPDQLTGCQLVRCAGSTQCAQHVELVRLEAVLRERRPTLAVKVPGEPGDAGQHGQRCDVQVGPLAMPRVEQRVGLVTHAGMVSRCQDKLSQCREESGCGTRSCTGGSQTSGTGPSTSWLPGSAPPRRRTWSTSAAVTVR